MDAAGRDNANGVTVGAGAPLTTTVTLDNNSLPLNISLPNAVQQNSTYDGASRLTLMTAENTATPTALNNSYQYGYNSVGWTSGITTTVQGSATSQSLSHDALGRLAAVTGAAPTGSWSYDGDGNLTSATSNGVTSTYSYDPAHPHQLTSVATTGQPITYYAYDGAGDTTSITNTSTLNRQLSYDAQARLVQITLGSPITSTVALAYNVFGERASYTVTPAGAGQPSLAEQFSYQGGELAQVAYTGTGVTTPYTDTYVYTQNGAPLELLRQTGGTITPYWYVLDGQGNVAALTNATGAVVDSYRYDQWGKLVTISESVPQQLRYAGYWYDNELGWYWLTVRAYDPALARFVQPDPSEQEGLFSYVYANDNPADQADPSGLSSTPPPFGCLVTSDHHFDCDEAVGSSEWNEDLGEGDVGVVKVGGAWKAEISAPHQCGGVGGGIFVIGGPIQFVTNGLCLVSGKVWRTAGMLVQNLVGEGCGLATSPRMLLGASLGLSVLIGSNLLCPDLKTLVGDEQGSKILAALDAASWLVPGLDWGKAGEALTRFGLELPALATEFGPRAAQILGCALCFPADTMVATPQGSRPIQALKVGDQVLAENPTTGKVEVESIQAVRRDPVSALMQIHLADGSSIKVTADHPFWVDGNADFTEMGWRAAGQLQIGDHLRTASGAEATVAELQYQIGAAVVYTLTVAPDHTFFVGSARVLVHNSNCPSDILAASIEIATGRVRSYGERAHHIVAYSSKYAVDARRILAKYGIGINDAENGVILSAKYHSRLHTLDYYAGVDYVLQAADSLDLSNSEFREVLRLMGKDIEQGSFPF